MYAWGNGNALHSRSPARPGWPVLAATCESISIDDPTNSRAHSLNPGCPGLISLISP
jgi:hypothetical protein